MKKAFAAVVMLSCAVAFAQADKKMAPPGQEKKTEMKGEMKGSEMKGSEMAQGGMGGWKPSKVTKEDKAGVEAFFKKMEDAMGKQDGEAMASMVDFPVTMITDDSSGNGMSVTQEKGPWMKMMADSMKGMPKDMPKPTMKRTMNFISDNLVVVVSENTMKMGKETMKWKGSDTLIKKNGQWMSKVMMEGGWGDMMKGTGGTGSTMDHGSMDHGSMNKDMNQGTMKDNSMNKDMNNGMKK